MTSPNHKLPASSDEYDEWLDRLDLRVPLPVLRPVHQERKFVTSTAASAGKTKTAHRRELLTDADDALGATRSAMFDVPVDAALDPHDVERFRKAFNRSSEPLLISLFRYLVAYGGPRPKPELAPEHLAREVHEALGLLFAVLDRDGDGRIDAEDIRVAAPFIGVVDYSVSYFRRVDRNCHRTVDFLYFVRAFFPQHSLKKILALQNALAVPLVTRILTTREQLSKEHVQEIDVMFRVFDTMEGRCSLENFTRTILDPTLRKHAAELFRQCDSDSDGVLQREEFLEMVKHNYPPFKLSKLLVELQPVDMTKYLAAVKQDTRVYLPHPCVKIDVPRYGTKGLEAVAQTARERDRNTDNVQNLSRLSMRGRSMRDSVASWARK